MGNGYRPMALKWKRALEAAVDWRLHQIQQMIQAVSRGDMTSDDATQALNGPIEDEYSARCAEANRQSLLDYQAINAKIKAKKGV